MSRGGTKIKPPFQFTPLREGRPKAQQPVRLNRNFNSRPSARGDVADGLNRAWGIVFQFTPLREGRRKSPGTAGKSFLFQFTPLREGRQRYEVTDAASGEFQFTPLREGRPRALLVARKLHLFQFTPLREGRHLYTRAVCLCLDISIHAPPRGATLRRTRFWRLARYFNSRPSARGDDCNHHGRGDGTVISIHAPPRGATAAASTMAGLSSYFNSRPSARGDAHPHSCIRTARIFQFTPLREGRPPFVVFRCSMLLQFQFTPLREGRLVELSAITGLPYISIHAPPRGATIPLWTFRWGAAHFNSRPSARGDTLVEKVKELPDISIHAPPRGATSTGNPAVQCQYFNSRPSARGDSPSPAMPVKFFDFNSRPSARGDAALYVNGRKMSISIHAPPRGATSVRGRW